MAEAGRKERLRIEFPAGERAPAELPASGSLVLGSSAARADVVLEGEGVEDVHCTIRRLKGGGWALVDTGTRIGTRVNGRLASKVRLQHGDRVTIGPVRLEITDPRSANRPVPPEELSTGPAAPAPPPAGTQPAALAGEASGVRISGYRIERTLGRGGMGQVYLAVQERLDRKVALKVLPPRLAADAQFVRRFEDEARAAAALNHPNVVTVYDVGEEGGKHFLSMEYMHQGCLESRLSREGRFPWPVVLGVLRDAAAGLVYAESRGIVHRDIKPSNLMQNEDGATKIADLGLAVQVEEGDADGADRLLGTPHFIAPELIRGEKADSRSDLYSLGATAYRLVTGSTPFDGDSAREILRHVLHDQPRPVASLAPEVPADLAASIERLLAKDPIERHPSAAILLAELERIADGGSVPTPATTGGSPGVGKLVLGGAAAGLLAAGIWFAQGALRGGEPEGAAVAAGGEADRGPRAAERSSGEQDGPDFEGLTFEEEETDAHADSGAAPDDMAARLLEAEAEVEYLKLGEEALSDEEREVRLDDLAGRYKGTNTAFKAAAEAEASRAARAEAVTLRRENRAAVDQALAEAREQTTGIAAIEVNAALRAVRETAVPERLVQDPFYLEGRRALEGEVVTRAIEATRAVLDRADTLAAEGDFEGVRTALEDYCRGVQLPQDGGAESTEPSDASLPPTTPPPGAALLEQLATRAFARLAGLDEEELAWRDSQLARDRLVMAQVFRGTGDGKDGVAAQLAGFELEAAHAAVTALAGEVQTRLARNRVGRLAHDIDGARKALEGLGSSWNEWRRRSVTDPRATRLTSQDTVGADARGVLIAGDSGTEHVSWSAWSRNPRGLHVLFNERLDRPWSGGELEGIASLFLLAATSHAAAWATEAIGGTHEGETSWPEVSEFYDQALEWASAAGQAEALEGERETARLLSEALAAADEGSPSVALARLERLLREHSESLLVLLLSDGGDWDLARPPLPSAASADGSGPTTAPGPVRPGPGPGSSPADGDGGDEAGED